VENNIKIKRALISVYDKAQLKELAAVLQNMDVEILSTGGTAKYLSDSGFQVTGVSDVTGFPEILGGRVKTLHPAIHGAILAKRQQESQMHELQSHGIELIDLVVVNLYPFEKTVADPKVILDDALENIDIGGPCMIRAAAKNFPAVAVITAPEQYKAIIEELEENGGLSLSTRRRLAVEAFRRTSAYDQAIDAYLSEKTDISFPELYTLRLRKVQDLRYGENPHQQAAFYKEAAASGKPLMEQLHGKELSFNNLLDMNAAIGMSMEFEEPCAVVLKHNNPCGVATDEDLLTAYENAFRTDSISAFGGVVAFNRTVPESVAEKMSNVFLEVIVAPDFSEQAIEILTKKKNIRLIRLLADSKEEGALDIKKIFGGYLLQNVDQEPEDESTYRVVTTRQPTEREWQAMRFGWKIVKWVKSNAVIYVSEKQTLGIGAGQMSRVDASTLAVEKAKQAKLDLRGSAVASDAFFPFPDGVEAAAASGATAVIQPGGSIRDELVIKAAEDHDMAMVFTGRRHFRH
jgi:phosphoribosylaminoimidazolecarboxamide formyltransferase/IMP cyclohydrolase